MARCLIYRVSDGLVVNSVIWDGGPGWGPPEGHAAVFDDKGAIGQIYNAGVFSDPPAVVAPPREPTPVEKIVNLLAQRFSLPSSDKEVLLATE